MSGLFNMDATLDEGFVLDQINMNLEMVEEKLFNQGEISVHGLFNYKDSACFECIFSSSEKSPLFLDCSSEGVLGVTTSLVGTLMVAETIKLICGTGQLLLNKLLVCDALSGATEILNVKKNQKCSACQNVDLL